jgi:hypothetical protein
MLLSNVPLRTFAYPGNVLCFACHFYVIVYVARLRRRGHVTPTNLCLIDGNMNRVVERGILTLWSEQARRKQSALRSKLRVSNQQTAALFVQTRYTHGPGDSDLI